MPLVPAICTQCGAQIEVDNTHEAGVCKCCGTAFITEKAINKYTTNITNHISIEHADIINELEQADGLYSRANTFMKLGESFKALDTFLELTDKFPDDYRGWWGCALVTTDNFTRLTWWADTEKFEKHCKNAMLLANEDEKEEIQQYLSKYEELLEEEQINNERAINNANYCNKYNYASVMKALGFWMSPTINKYGVPIDDGHSYTPEFTYVLGNIVKYRYYYLRKSYGGTSEKVKEYSKEYVDKCNNYVDGNIEELLSNASPKSPETSGCYIATCVYGSYDCPQVWTLRRFRDYTLDKTWYGRLFVKCYYAISPTLVKWCGNQKWFRTFWKNYLDTMVFKLHQQGIEDTRYSDKY